MPDLDYLLDSYDYDLPEEIIAQSPCDVPGSSRLLVMERNDQPGLSASLRDAEFKDLPTWLPPGTLLVANNAKVLPARIKWQRTGGGKAEFLLLTPLPLIESSGSESRERRAVIEALLKPGAKFRQGQTLQFTTDLHGTILEKEDYGRHKLELRWSGSLAEIFARDGSLPLPPYIKRDAGLSDSKRYQTIYATKNGAMAAPTAGLHFTPALRDKLLAKNFSWRELTLYVGYGTFSPVRCENIRQHSMHREYVELDAATAASINEAISQKRPIVAVGTTSLRALEGIAARFGEIREYSGWIDIFIYPGFEFKVINGLITNFHLPKSSLLMLVSAFAGRKKILEAYAHAIKNGYRFFSYGDAMLIR